MLSTRKVWLGLVAAAAALALATVAGAQLPGDFPHLGGNQARTGRNGDPVTFTPGIAQITWFWPNDLGGAARPGTIVRDNNSKATKRNPDWPIKVWRPAPTGPLDTVSGFYFVPLPVFNNPAENAVTGAVAIDQRRLIYPAPIYDFTTSTPCQDHDHPTLAQFPAQLASFDFTIDPHIENLATPAGNYQVFASIPSGPSSDPFNPPNLIFPNRYYIFEIDYGNGLQWFDVVDTNVAGQGWIRLGNGGFPTNMVFPYDGIHPIHVKLFNTQWRDIFNNILEDNSVQRGVFADGAMAVPDYGSVTATPVITQIATGTANQRNQLIEAVNLESVTFANGSPQTTTLPQLLAFLGDGTRPGGNPPIWTWSPVEVTPFTVPLDNPVPPDIQWTSENIVPHIGLDYLTSPITNTVAAADWVTYQPTLEDGDYLIQVYCGGNQGAQLFGTQTTIYVWEGATLAATIQVDQSVAGWVTLSNQRFKHRGTIAENLHVQISNYSPLATDLGLKAYADEVRFIGAFNETITATPVQTNVLITPKGGGAPVPTDVVLVACEDGHLYCLDALGNGNGTTTLYWSWPTILRPNTADTDPNTAITQDGDGNGNIITQMPDTGFGLGSPLIQHFGPPSPGGTDVCYVAGKNGRVYSINMSGRGDYDATIGRVGTTNRIWSFPDDWPAPITQNPLAGGVGGSVSFAYTAVGPANPTIFVPAMEGRLFALDAGGGANHTTTTRWMYPAKTTQNLGSVTTTPIVDFNRVYFGTARLNDTVPGQFYALNADTGAFVWNFEGDPAGVEAGDFRGGPCSATAALLGIPNNMVFCSNDNLFVYGLDADTGALLWQTSELNTTVSAHLTFTWMAVPDLTGTNVAFPLVMVPTDDGRFDGLFARPLDVNVANLKQAWEYVAGSNSIQASMSNGWNFLYGADMSGNLYAWSQNPEIAGMGEPPGTATQTADTPIAQAFRNAKITRITEKAYQLLRQSDTTGDIGTQDYTTFLKTPANIHQRSAYEWGETAYFLVYDFPFYQNNLVDGAAINPPVVNFQIGVEGASVRQYAVQSKQWLTYPAPPPQVDGYAILAFPIQGAGPTSLPPGSATVRASFSTAAGNNRQQVQNVAFNTATAVTIANPLGIIMPDANGNMGLLANTFGLNTDPATIERQRNGTPNILGGTDGRLLGNTEGVVGNGQTGIGNFWLVDMSMLVLLKGGSRGLEQVRFTRPELAWLGGAGAIYKPIDQILYPGYEDWPVNFPNSSIDYPNIGRENLRATKDPAGIAENLIVSTNGVSLVPPILPANYDDTMLTQRVPQPVLGELDIDVPRFQPANNHNGVNDPLNLYFTNSAGNILPSGYLARIDAYVDSNGNGQFDGAGGRREAFRAFVTNIAVALDERLSVTTPTVDDGILPEGAGYAPIAPGFPGAGNTLSPWGTAYASMTNLAGVTVNPLTTTNLSYIGMFQPLTIEADGNVNMLNVRLAKGVVGGATPGPWPIFSNSVDDLGWLDSSQYVWTNFDKTFGLMPTILLQKARVGDRFPTILSLNPERRYNQNIGVRQSVLFPGAKFDPRPMIAATPPIGFPVGDYSQIMEVIDDLIPWGGGVYGDQFVELSGNGSPLEPMSSPTFTFKFKSREFRATGNFTTLTAPMIDFPPVPIPGGQNLTYTNSQPTGLRTLDGNLLGVYSSPQPAFNSPVPGLPVTDPAYRLYFATLAGTAPVPAPFTSPLLDLGQFIPNPSNTQWFRQQVGPFPVGPFDPLFQTGAGETIIAGSEKFSSPALPANGVIDPLSGTAFQASALAFLGQADKQTTAGRATEYRIMAASVSVNAAGAVGLSGLISMPYDPATPKGRPSIYQTKGGAVIFYSSSGTGEAQLYYTVTDGASFSRPTIFSVGNGFEEVGAPSVQLRPYTGAGGPPRPIMELSFIGKLRGRPNSEVFFGRAFTSSTNVNGNPVNNTPGVPLYLPLRTKELMTPDAETGTYRASGVIWNPATPFALSQSLDGGVTWVNLEKPGTRVTDRASGLIRFDTLLGGQAYVDPTLGTVRFATTAPLRTALLGLDYSPRFLRVSEANVSGHASPAVLWDNRIAGDISNFSYWFDVASNGTLVNVNPVKATPRTARYLFTYTQAAAGAGLAARPYWKSVRVGVQLPTPIATDAGGNVTNTVFIVGATGPVQVDPANGRIYFQEGDEDRNVTIKYVGINPATQATFAVPNPPGGYNVGAIVERPESAVPIDQAVNESTMSPFLDPFDLVNPRRPGLIWMFYVSTRAGSADLYFQTMAPRFTPTVNGK
ncbi:MAG: PQQ-binding-like beta-propeller repeat protein [Fimbriimonadales bacterium]